MIHWCLATTFFSILVDSVYSGTNDYHKTDTYEYCSHAPVYYMAKNF